MGRESESWVTFFDYMAEPRIPWWEKLLVIALTLAYVIWPVDLLPGLIFDDLGVVGVIMLYMIWRVSRIWKSAAETQNAVADDPGRTVDVTIESTSGESKTEKQLPEND